MLEIAIRIALLIGGGSGNAKGIAGNAGNGYGLPPAVLVINIGVGAACHFLVCPLMLGNILGYLGG